jgi:hypothetical protein
VTGMPELVMVLRDSARFCPQHDWLVIFARRAGYLGW